MVDKNLFPYDLAVVAIMKGEEPYVKEWIDYHLLAGVDHFYIYDNDSTPEFKKILQPYIDANIVNYTFYPGKVRQMEAYNDAVKRFRFQCRYLAIIDGDEFIFPKSKSTVAEVVDEVLNKNPNASGLVANYIIFGSNAEEKADYSRGVLERFVHHSETQWAPLVLDKESPVGTSGNAIVKSIHNPRKVALINHPHFAVYLPGYYAVNEKGGLFSLNRKDLNFPVDFDKIVINHYMTKSIEEYHQKFNRGAADGNDKAYTEIEMRFKWFDRNEVFDDGIVKYRDARRGALIGKGGGGY